MPTRLLPFTIFRIADWYRSPVGSCLFAGWWFTCFKIRGHFSWRWRISNGDLSDTLLFQCCTFTHTYTTHTHLKGIWIEIEVPLLCVNIETVFSCYWRFFFFFFNNKSCIIFESTCVHTNWHRCGHYKRLIYHPSLLLRFWLVAGNGTVGGWVDLYLCYVLVYTYIYILICICTSVYQVYKCLLIYLAIKTFKCCCCDYRK